MINLSKYVGTPFVEHGSDLNGCDCWGLVRLVYKNELDIDLPCFAYENIDQREMFAGLMAGQPLILGFDEVSDPQPFDVAVMREAGFDSHLAIFIDRSRILHVKRGTDTIIENVSSPHIKPRIKRVYRYVS